MADGFDIGGFHLVDDDGKTIDFDLSPSYFTKRDLRKQRRHLKAAKIVDDWGEFVADSVAACSDMAVTGVSYAAFDALERTTTGAAPTIGAKALNVVAAVGLGITTYMLVRKAAKYEVNAFYNIEMTLGLAGMGYFELLQTMCTPPDRWTKKQLHANETLAMLGDDFMKECEW